MKTFDEFMKEGGIFVEILSSILSGRSYTTRRRNFETPGSSIDGVGVLIDQ